MDDEATPDDAAEAERIRGEIPIERVLTGNRRVVRFAVGRNHGRGWRLDKYLHAVCPTISRAMLRRWLDAGCATVDGRVAETRAKLRPGQRVELAAPLPHDETPATASPPLAIVYEDPQFLVCDKPAGVLAHQAGRVLSGTLLNQIQDWLEARGRDPRQARLVNRIDRDTSGLVLASLDLVAHEALATAMEARDLRKEYRAICHRVPTPAHGHWREAIAEAGDESIAMRIAPDGKDSHTEYDVLETPHVDAPAFALLRVRLHTGRQHQIRIHASHHGHALVGDWVYGTPCAELPGQALHAALLEFRHPRSGGLLCVETPLPAALTALWQQLRDGGAPTPTALSDEQRSKLGLIGPAAIRRPAWLDDDEYQRLREERGC